LTFFISKTLVFAQANSGTIAGSVFDPQEALVPGVTVTITQTQQNVTRTVVTNSTGLYEAKFLPVGPYSVSVEHAGFKKQVKTDLILNIGQTMRVDFRLEVGGGQEVVEVRGDASQALKLETSEISQVINHSQVMDLPLNGRNFDDLIPLNAGVTNGMQRASKLAKILGYFHGIQ